MIVIFINNHTHHNRNDDYSHDHNDDIGHNPNDAHLIFDHDICYDHDDHNCPHHNNAHLNRAGIMPCSLKQAGHPHCQVANLVLRE